MPHVTYTCALVFVGARVFVHSMSVIAFEISKGTDGHEGVSSRLAR